VSDRDQDRLVTRADRSTSWPGGWYVYENGRVQGPFAAEVAFASGSESVIDGVAKQKSDRLVSRKGFSQWYPLGELAELYRLTDKLGHRTAQEVDKLESQIAENLANLEVLRALVQTGADPTVIAGTPGLGNAGVRTRHPGEYPRVVGETISSSLQNTSANAAAMASVQPQPLNDRATAAEPPRHAYAANASPTIPKERKLSRKEKKALARNRNAPDVEPTPEPQSPLVSGVAPRFSMPAGAPASGVQPAVSHRTPSAAEARNLLVQEYATLRGRLRLGEARSPWLVGFGLFPVSIGAYWGIWFTDATREVSWHLNNSSDLTGMPAPSFAWIPLVHIYMAWCLAKMVREMERQNGYSNTSPALAAMFALIPPFAMIYLQECMNQHWWLHVRHAVMARTS